MLSLAFALPSTWTPQLPLSGALAGAAAPAFDRRALLGGAFAATVVAPLSASAQIESVNPANNYYVCLLSPNPIMIVRFCRMR